MKIIALDLWVCSTLRPGGQILNKSGEAGNSTTLACRCGRMGREAVLLQCANRFGQRRLDAGPFAPYIGIGVVADLIAVFVPEAEDRGVANMGGGVGCGGGRRTARMSELSKLLELPWLPIGTFFNVICIFIGGVVGLRLSRQLTEATQHRIRKFLAVLTVLAGGYMICNGL